MGFYKIHPVNEIRRLNLKKEKNMMTKKILFALSLGCLFAISSISEVSTGTPKTRKRSSKKTTQKLAIPIAGKKYKLGDLFNLINTNNSRTTSNFLVLDARGISRSASTVGVSRDYIEENADTTVQLFEDGNRIKELEGYGILDSKTSSQYRRILLYFQLDGIDGKIYLNDPAPGKIVRSAFKTTNPAQNIINKWDFNKSF